MLHLHDLKARMERLDAVMRGLAKEVLLVQKADDPLLYRERKGYLEAIQDAIAGLETARVMLAQGVQRIEEAQRGRQW